MGLTLDEEPESPLQVNTAVASRLKMLPDIPAAMRVIKKFGATDLAEMLFGSDNPEASA